MNETTTTLEIPKTSNEEKDIYRDIDDVVYALKKAKDEGINVNLLIGAGCSVTAGIPAAQGMINMIKKEFPKEFERAIIKNYPNCMSKLTPSERKNLISSIVENAKVNWTHVAIAQLLKSGYINRILTPNFDNLIQRSCSLVGEFPAIYDLATSSVFRTDLLFDKSVIHLHGQHTGFILCNTEKEVEAQSNNLKPIFEQLDQKSLWIIIGYSGDNDPIFRLLARKELFEHRLFWIGYEDNEPSVMLKDQLLSDEKYAFYVKGFNSDDFFVKVSQKLNCFPPAFIQKPFTYLSDTLDTLAQYKVPAPSSNLYVVNDFNDIHIVTKKVVEGAINTIENNKNLMAQHYLMAGLFDEVIQLSKESTVANEDTKIDYEFEYQVINALRSRQKKEDNDIRNALERLKKLDSEFPNNHVIKNDLATLYFLMNVETLDPSNEETWNKSLKESLSYIELSMEHFDQSQQLKNEIGNIISWDARLYLILKYSYKNFTNKEKKHFIDETLTKFFKHLHSFNSIDDFEHYDFQIVYTIYWLIEKQDFECAKFILDNIQKSKILSYLSKAYLMANWGFWHLNNESISSNLALEKGIDFYQKALETLLESPKISSNEDPMYIGFKQKSLLEHAKFLIKKQNNLELSIQLLSECIEIGNNINVQGPIYKQATELLSSLQSQNSTLSQIASTSINE